MQRKYCFITFATTCNIMKAPHITLSDILFINMEQILSHVVGISVSHNRASNLNILPLNNVSYPWHTLADVPRNASTNVASSSQTSPIVLMPFDALRPLETTICSCQAWSITFKTTKS